MDALKRLKSENKNINRVKNNKMISKYSILAFGLTLSCQVKAFSFDPVVINAMNEASVAIKADLALPDSTFCGLKKQSKKEKRNCLIYRKHLIGYGELIQAAADRIDSLEGWAPTISLFNNSNDYFAFPPQKFFPMSRLQSVERLQILYDAIYAYPIKP